MENEELISVNVVIADRSYRLKTLAADEEVIRKVAKLINDKITEYKTAYSGKDMQDYVSMALLWFAVEQAKPQNDFVTGEEDSITIEEIHLLLDKALQTP